MLECPAQEQSALGCRCSWSKHQQMVFPMRESPASAKLRERSHLFLSRLWNPFHHSPPQSLSHSKHQWRLSPPSQSNLILQLHHTVHHTPFQKAFGSTPMRSTAPHRRQCHEHRRLCLLSREQLEQGEC